MRVETYQHKSGPGFIVWVGGVTGAWAPPGEDWTQADKTDESRVGIPPCIGIHTRHGKSADEPGGGGAHSAHDCVASGMSHKLEVKGLLDGQR